MRIVLVMSLFLLVCACDRVEPKETNMMKVELPEEYVLMDDAVFRGDTAYRLGERFSGYLFRLYADSRDTAVVLGYYEGLQTGGSWKWFPNKALMEERYFLKGKKNGRQVAYWGNGNKKFEFTARDDMYEGEMKEWNYAGKLIHWANYVNGQEEGAQKLWYDNGKIRANYVIVKGKRFGLLGTKNCVNVSDSIVGME